MSDQITQLQQLGTQLGITAQLKPVVMLPDGEVQIRDTATELYKLIGNQQALFYSKGLVVKSQQQSASSLPILIPLDAVQARSEFEKYAKFGKQNGKKAVMSESDAKALLACDVARDLLPNVNGLLNRPIPVLHNCRIEILHTGYNASTGFLVTGGAINEPETVEEAVQLLNSIIMDFTFQGEADLSRAIAALLTPAMKLGSFIAGKTPIEIIEATESQTGKGFFLHLRSLVYGEVPILLTQRKGGVGSLDEDFGSALLHGRPFIQLDNVRGELKSAFLESYLTNPGMLSIRTPYSKAQMVDGSYSFIAITSNGLITNEDLANRASFVRLEKEANREFTKVQGQGIEELIRSLQATYMGAVTKVIRHYHEQGMPRTNENRHNMREWAQKLDWIVQNIFQLPPLMDGNQEAQMRVQNPALGFVREVAIHVEKAGRLGHELRAQHLVDICEAGGVEIPGLNKKGEAGYTDKQVAQRIGQLLGQAFGNEHELTVEPFQIIRTERLGMTGGGNTYSGKRYEFRRIVQETPEDPVQTAVNLESEETEGQHVESEK